MKEACDNLEKVRFEWKISEKEAYNEYKNVMIIL